jgi:hypothetical protein
VEGGRRNIKIMKGGGGEEIEEFGEGNRVK